MVRWTLALLVMTAAAHADPAQNRGPIRGAVTPEGAKPCAQPACDAAATAPDADQMKPVDVKIALGDLAIASMEGVWLRRGPTLRKKPILVSPIVVGNALTLSLGGSF